MPNKNEELKMSEELKKEDMQNLTPLETIEWLEYIVKDTEKKIQEIQKLFNEKGW